MDQFFQRIGNKINFINVTCFFIQLRVKFILCTLLAPGANATHIIHATTQCNSNHMTYKNIKHYQVKSNNHHMTEIAHIARHPGWSLSQDAICLFINSLMEEQFCCFAACKNKFPPWNHFSSRLRIPNLKLCFSRRFPSVL